MIVRLKPGGSATCRPGALTVALRVTEGAPARLVAVGEAGAAHGLPAAQHDPMLLVISELASRVGLRVVPDGPQATLPGGCLVSAKIVIDRSDLDESDDVMLPESDGSGLPFLDLAVLEPVADGSICIHAKGQDAAVTPTARPAVEPTLSGLADVARTSARMAAGGSQVPLGDRRRAELVVDRSASMALTFRDGSLPAAMSMVLGANDVVGDNQHWRLWCASTSVAEVVDDGGSWMGRLGQVFQERGTGFRLLPLLRQFDGVVTATRVFVFTDDLPCDAEVFFEEVRGRGRDDLVWVLVLIARSRYDGLDPGSSGRWGMPTRDDVRRLVPEVPRHVTIVSFASPSAADLASVLGRLEAMVRAVRALTPDVLGGREAGR